MSSGFVSGGTVDNPTERDDEWRRAQQELAEERQLKDAARHDDSKSLYEVLQANKAAKQDAFEEANRLKNQYRALDDDEAEFLDSVLEAKRKQEAAVKKDTLEQLDVFRRQQEEAERKALEENNPDAPAEGHVQWLASGRKRKKGNETSLLRGVKLKKASSTGEDKAKPGQTVETGGKTPASSTATATTALEKIPTAAKTTPASPPAKSLVPVSLGLGYASSDEDD
ncbi:N-terminal domain of NEFA-interacting nuclear protein NIP30-domain-containing protein [Massariosphaeria phaeospora]|uniref:N-terminal domain of NEFA-interacting nuclear protein NIP30-domain-containing protein n=1 Tax=Massariosphaeria phaeospora TaxID=100035 RepID=A0A7C8M8U4_9PLEO|nr:N-terminal domain of NEFA-interacting nuclear protein NIP30-domain-containing protein [Massariosphaeria phaeospora]